MIDKTLEHTNYEVVIVGAGIAGLTAAAYLCSAGRKVLICDKNQSIGGLINSFQYNGFTFDGGIRAIENSGIVRPMLRQLGINVDFVDNPVSIGIEDEVIRLVSADSLSDYRTLLLNLFPESIDDIDQIVGDIHKIMGYMDVLYGIDNPLFLDMKKDPGYLIRTLLPWMFRFLFTLPKIQKLQTPIDEYMKRLTENPELTDMIAQHFFQKTPAFFALSYFSLYLDYQYPKGGTSVLIRALEQFILEHGGDIRTDTEISSFNPHSHQITDALGNRFSYQKMIWTGDLKTLYRVVQTDLIPDKKTRDRIIERRNELRNLKGGDSILTLYLTVDMDSSVFESICSPHFFYTPSKKGLSSLDQSVLSSGSGFTTDRRIIQDWIQQYLQLTTFEISIPVMRDQSLAPPGQTGLIISTLFDYSLAEHIHKNGWMDAFKEIAGQTIVNALDQTIFPGIRSRVNGQFLSTPLTLEKRTGNTGGAITGWAFTNNPVPAVDDTLKVARSVLTPIPDVCQAGQWTFSPSGLPISVLTGKLAADRVGKELKRQG